MIVLSRIADVPADSKQQTIAAGIEQMSLPVSIGSLSWMVSAVVAAACWWKIRRDGA